MDKDRVSIIKKNLIGINGKITRKKVVCQNEAVSEENICIPIPNFLSWKAQCEMKFFNRICVIGIIILGTGLGIAIFKSLLK